MNVTDEIKDRLDIIEVIQAYVPLKKAGRSYKGLCPFHTEKTPSFVVFPDTGTWHCFGACGTGGDIFSFIMKRENLDFAEALRLLAQRAGVPLEAPSPQSTEAQRQVTRLHEINQAAALYFHHLLLHSDEGARARSYLGKRGFLQETIDRFQVGYALQQWDGLLRFLTSKGYSVAELVEAGLVIEREDKSGYYDRFRARIIFPIRDSQGQTIGFGGRVLDDGVPKYLNSPQTAIFDKSSALFGLDQARQGIRSKDQVVIVEGYTDVLMAHQLGITNVVAQMGTALTERQLQQLKRHTHRFILALDPDLAGDQATLRGLDVARQVVDREVVPVPTSHGLIRFEERLAADIRIASLPPGRDPDEVIRESPDLWAKLVDSARPIMDYYFEAHTAGLDLATAKGKAEAVRLLGPLIAEIGDSVQRTHYLQRLARMVQSDERALWQQIQQSVGRKRRPAVSSPPDRAQEEEDGSLGLEAHCLSYVLYHPYLLHEADAAFVAGDEPPLHGDDLRQPEDRAVLDTWRRWLANGGAPDVRGAFYDTLDGRLQDRVDQLLRVRGQEPVVPEDLLRDKVLDAITLLRLRNLRRQEPELRFLVEDSRALGDREAYREYGQHRSELSARIRRLEKAINSRSLSGRRQREDASLRVPSLEM